MPSPFSAEQLSPAMRERYGTGHRGQCYLLGRKLIESGVRFVTIDCREPPSPRFPGGGNMNWDHHDHIYSEKDTNIKGGGAGLRLGRADQMKFE